MRTNQYYSEYYLNNEEPIQMLIPEPYTRSQSDNQINMDINQEKELKQQMNNYNESMDNSSTTQGTNESIEEGQKQDQTNYRQERELFSVNFQKKTNYILIQHYGTELYEHCKELEQKSVFDNLLKNHRLDSETRTKMVDWMIEVLTAYNSDNQALFLAIHVMDSYINKCTKKLTNEDIHLVGLTCMYIASKMEDIIPLRMSIVKTKIGHGKFSEMQIKNMEKEILGKINFDLIITSTYDFVKTFIFDFSQNNSTNIERLSLTKHIEALDNITIYLSKLMLHHEEFGNYK
jgi:hypothetical protein